jgi:predicted phage terminase large subunit-like protein
MDITALQHATPEELEALEASLIREVGLLSPADFAATVEGDRFLEPAHITYLSDCIRDLCDGALLKEDGQPYKRLLVTMPPRHGKSELTSRYTPAWFIARNPRNRVILASYEADFAAEWGGKVRELIAEHGKDFGVTLNPTTKAKDKWLTQHGGGMSTAGGKGAITGKGANLFIIDDPFKNDDEANSELIRNKVFGMFQSTAFTRLEPGGVVIVIQTRWHEDDLAGRLLRDQESEWFHVDFPAVAEGDGVDLLGRTRGEPLWEGRYNAEALAEIKEAVGSYVWNALYQQRPFIEGGGILQPDKFQRFYERDGVYFTGGGQKMTSKQKIWRFVTVDTAGTSKTYSDYTVACVFDVTPDKEALLVHVDRLKIDSSELFSWLKALYERFEPRFIGIENRTYGTTLLQTALRAGLRVRELKADTDKITRAYGMIPFQENGRLQLPTAAPWLADLEHELQAFPYGSHDDQIDALAYAAVVLRDTTTMDRVRGPKPEKTQIQRHLDSVFKKKKQQGYHPMLGRF